MGRSAGSKISGNCFGCLKQLHFGGFKTAPLPETNSSPLNFGDCETILSFWGLAYFQGLLLLVLGKAAFIHWSNHSHHLVIVFYKKKRHPADGYCRSEFQRQISKLPPWVSWRGSRRWKLRTTGANASGVISRGLFFFWLVLRKGILA